MGLFALLLAGLAGWLIWTGRLQRMSAKDGMALGAALAGAVMAAKGKPLIGVPLLAGAILFFSRNRTGRKKVEKPQPVPSQTIVEARKLLGVGPDADAREIRAAHRRLIASVHPDKGGTESLAAQINAARDLLIKEDSQRP